MKKTICVVTGTRAEYGLLKPLIKKINNSSSLILNLVVTGMHLSPEFGYTYKFIENDQIKINKKIETLLSSDTSVGISKSMGLSLISFSEYFSSEKFDMLIVLGDRFEILSVATAATICHIPICHIHGGETTEGAYDESFRHCISKMSYLHFTSTELYRKRVIQLGENPNRVFNVGALGVENIKNISLMSLNSLENLLNFKLDKPYALVTFHPVTLENSTFEYQINELLKALDSFPNMKFLITKSNCDTGGTSINKILENYCSNNESNAILFSSLGQTAYLSAMSYASMVIGNSSSGIIEAPSFNIPTINIGNRQKGRFQSSSTINCNPISSEIISSIIKGLSNEFRQSLINTINPYEGYNTSTNILKIIEETLNSNIDLKKNFYDL